MKRILYIAKNELYSLFYSPIAWLLLMLFLFLTGLDYIFGMDVLLRDFIRGGESLANVHELTNTLISKRFYGYFPKIIANLYMIFPLITMGLISREFNNGTIKLLYSSPVKVWEVVLGKYLAMIVFSMTLIILVCITLSFFPATFTYPAYSQMLAAVIGIFLVLCCYAAIGLFISSLTSYQVVAAIITLVVFGLLNIISRFFEKVDILRDITYYLNFAHKSSNFIKGFLNSRDLFYFLLIISLFLLFTIIGIENKRQSVSVWKKLSRYGIVALGALLTGYLTSRPSFTAYYDSTRDELFTIAKPTRTTLAKLNDGALTITAYANLMNGGGRFYPPEQNEIVSSIWEPYIRFKPDIDIHFKYYYNNPDSFWFKNRPGKTLEEIKREIVKADHIEYIPFMKPDEARKLVDIDKEGNRSFFVLEYKGRKVVLRTFDDPIFWPLEDEIAAALNRLVEKPPVIYFLTGEMERNPFSATARNYQPLVSSLGARQALINIGYDVDTVNLKSRDLPAGGTTLVIADPRVALDPVVLSKVRSYIASGGNLFVLGEPDRDRYLAPILDTLGISFRAGRLIQPSDKYASDDIFTYLSDTAKNLSPQFRRLLKDHLIYYGDSLQRVVMPGTAAIHYERKDGFTVKPLLSTDAILSWNRVDPVDKDSLQTKLSPRATDEHGSFPTSVLLERQIHGHDQRIIVSGDADYLMARASGQHTYNDDFTAQSFGCFAYGRIPANTLRPEDKDNAFTIGLKGRDAQKMVLYYIIPGLIGLIGSVVLIRRRRK